MKIIKRKEAIVFLLVLAAAGLIGYNFVYKFNLKRIEQVKLRSEEEEKKNQVLKVIGVLDKKLTRYQQRSLATAELTQFLDQVSGLAQQAGVQIESFTPQPTIQKEQYQELPIRIPLTCTYHQLGQFLSLLESNQEFIWVKNVNIQKKTVTDARELKVPKIDLTVSGFYFKK